MKKNDLATRDLIHETEVTVIGEGIHLNGELELCGVVRVYGKLSGKVTAVPGSQVVLMESSVVEGSLNVDSIVVAGFVLGDIHAKSRVSIEGTGRIIGNIDTPVIAIEFGAYVEGATKMTGATPRKATTSGSSPRPS